jgi:hypothetical protein
MAKITTLAKAIFRMPGAAANAVICARPPFDSQSDAAVVEINSDRDDNLRAALERQGFVIFLNKKTVGEVLDVSRDVEITRSQLVDLAIYYAEYGEYPGWYYQLLPK